MKLQYKSIGKNIARQDVLGKIRGDAKFCADIELKNPLSLKVLRSSRHHAVIENIDVAKIGRASCRERVCRYV